MTVEQISTAVQQMSVLLILNTVMATMTVGIGVMKIAALVIMSYFLF